MEKNVNILYRLFFNFNNFKYTFKSLSLGQNTYTQKKKMFTYLLNMIPYGVYSLLDTYVFAEFEN